MVNIGFGVSPIVVLLIITVVIVITVVLINSEK